MEARYAAGPAAIIYRDDNGTKSNKKLVQLIRGDLVDLRDDLASASGFLTDRGQSARFLSAEESAGWVRGRTSEGLLVALPSDRSVEDYHFEHALHGHNLKLTADPRLL